MLEPNRRGSVTSSCGYCTIHEEFLQVTSTGESDTALVGSESSAVEFSRLVPTM